MPNKQPVELVGEEQNSAWIERTSFKTPNGNLKFGVKIYACDGVNAVCGVVAQFRSLSNQIKEWEE